MRNLTEYPVTADEAISALQIAFEARNKRISDDGVGDIDGVALLFAERFISINKNIFNIFSKASTSVIFENE